MLILKINTICTSDTNKNIQTEFENSCKTTEDEETTYRIIDDKNRLFIPIKERIISNIEKNSI